MTVVVAHEVVPALALEAELTQALVEHQRLHVGLSVVRSPSQRVGAKASLIDGTAVDSLHQIESLTQNDIVVVGSKLCHGLSLHEHDVRKTVEDVVLAYTVRHQPARPFLSCSNVDRVADVPALCGNHLTHIIGRCVGKHIVAILEYAVVTVLREDSKDRSHVSRR